MATAAGTQVVQKANQWKPPIEELNEDLNFLRSINSARIGTGKMLYNEEKNALETRSNFSNYRIIQYISTIGYDTANFPACQKAFQKTVQSLTQLNDEFKDLDVKLEMYQDLKSCDAIAIEMQQTVSGISRLGLEQLCKSYGSDKDNSSSLRELGGQCFQLVEEVTASIERKMLSANPKGAMDITLKRESYRGGVFLEDLEKYVTELLAVKCGPEGAVLSDEFINGVKADMKRKGEQGRYEHIASSIRNAASAIQLSKSARPIPTLQGNNEWRSKRITSDRRDENVAMEDGVTGAYEQDGGEFDNLCNYYSLFDSQSKQLIVSCDSVETPRKEAQFLKAVGTAVSEFFKEPPKRSVVHMLYSCTDELPLISGMQGMVPKIENTLKPDKKEVTPSSLVPCVITSLKSEKRNPLQGTQNLEGLIRLTSFVLEDAKELLNDQTKNSSLQPITEFLVKNTEPTLQKILTDINNRRTNETKTTIESIETTIEPIEDFRASLRMNIDTVILPDIKKAIAKMENAYNKNLNQKLNKAILLFKILEEIYTSNDPNSIIKTTRFVELSLFYLLYQLLNTNIFMINGKDNRGGIGRAICNSLSQLKDEFFKQIEGPSKIKEHQRPFAAELSAGWLIFNTIRRFEIDRLQIFKLVKRLVREDSGFTVLSDINENAPNFSGNKKVLEKIDQMHMQKDTRESLRRNWRLQQLICANLLGPQSLIGFYSTGLVGQREDPLLLEILPPLIETASGKTFQIQTYHAGTMLSSPRFEHTQAGKDIILRSGELKS